MSQQIQEVQIKEEAVHRLVEEFLGLTGIEKNWISRGLVGSVLAENTGARLRYHMEAGELKINILTVEPDSEVIDCVESKTRLVTRQIRDKHLVQGALEEHQGRIVLTLSTRTYIPVGTC